jgi:hypothetical protein
MGALCACKSCFLCIFPSSKSERYTPTEVFKFCCSDPVEVRSTEEDLG